MRLKHFGHFKNKINVFFLMKYGNKECIMSLFLSRRHTDQRIVVNFTVDRVV